MALCFVFVASGCATITRGRYQKIPVVSNPSGAKVIVNGKELTSPCTLVLKRKQRLYKVSIKKEGYEPVEIVLQRTVPGWGVFWGWGNIEPVGIIVDWCTGAAYKLMPTELKVNLVQKKLGLNDLKDKNISIVSN
ncbi:MAG: PEGA domain-containing protein [bacterium]|nr:PEGA domain-containing protein [bacterium]